MSKHDADWPPQGNDKRLWRVRYRAEKAYWFQVGASYQWDKTRFTSFSSAAVYNLHWGDGRRRNKYGFNNGHDWKWELLGECISLDDVEDGSYPGE